MGTIKIDASELIRESKATIGVHLFGTRRLTFRLWLVRMLLKLTKRVCPFGIRVTWDSGDGGEPTNTANRPEGV